MAETGRHVGQVQQFDHHVFQHVAEPGAFAQALDKTAALADAAVVLQQGRQQRDQPVVETGQQVGGKVFQAAQVQPDFQHGPVSPDVGAAQVVDTQKPDVVLFAHVFMRSVNRPCRVNVLFWKAPETGASGFNKAGFLARTPNQASAGPA